MSFCSFQNELGKPATFGIFCRTYEKDRERLAYLLLSIEKFAYGFDRVVVTAPKTSLKALAPIVGMFKFAELKECNTWTSDYVAQQITKLTADRYIDTDFITHIDADCILIEEMTPEDLMEDGLPILYHDSYEYFYENDIKMPWQASTSALLKEEVDNEFMRRFPLTYPRTIYKDLQSYFRIKHGAPIDEIYNFVDGDSLSEFNLMGAFSFKHQTTYHKHINWRLEPPKQRWFIKQMCLIPRNPNPALIRADNVRTLAVEDEEILIKTFGNDEYNKLRKLLSDMSATDFPSWLKNALKSLLQKSKRAR